MATGGIGNITAETARALGALVPTTPTRPMADEGAPNTAAVNGVGFGEFLKNAIGEVNDLQQASTQATNDFIVGKTDSIHEVMIAAEKASVALQLTLEVRNKVLEAYQEINRMQI
jgi:flagellar hook-basal body complex protein FliE